MRAWPFVALAVAGIGWGLGFPLAELALPEVAPAPLMLLRFLAGCIVCLPLALRTQAGRAAFRDPWIWVAGFIYGPSFVLQFEGLARTSVTLSALMVGLLPALIALASPLIGETVTRRGWLGVAAATAGAVLIAARPGAAGTPLGITLLAAAMVAYLLWFLTLRRARANADILAAPSAMVVISTFSLALLVIPLHGLPPLHLSARAWTGVIGTGVLCTSIATVAWQLGAAKTSGATAGVFVNIEPVVGAALGVGLFGDRLTWSLALGGLMIVAGSVVAVLSDPPRRPAPIAPPEST